jgi:hypothetical protein
LAVKGRMSPPRRQLSDAEVQRFYAQQRAMQAAAARNVAQNRGMTAPTQSFVASTNASQTISQRGSYDERGMREPPPMSAEDAQGRIVDLRAPTADEKARISAVTRILAVPDFATLPLATINVGVLTPGTVPLQQMQFLESGWIVGLAIDTKNDGTHLGRSSIQVKLQVVGSLRGITTDTVDIAFIPVNLLCSDATTGASSVNVAPLVSHVTPDDRINVSFQNMSTATQFTPTAAFWFLRDEDCPDGVVPDPVGTDLTGCSRFCLVPRQPGVNVGIPAGQAGPQGLVEWQDDGIVTGFRADCNVDAGAGRANIQALIETWGGSRSAITSDGKSSAFVQVPLLAGGAEQTLRLRRRVVTTDKTGVIFRNTNGAATAFSPAGVFFFRVDDDLKRRRLRSL